MSDTKNYKADFPVFAGNKNLVYLDSSATTQKPQAVLDAVNKYYHEENANPLRGLYELSVRATDAYDNAREAVKQFIGAGMAPRSRMSCAVALVINAFSLPNFSAYVIP